MMTDTNRATPLAPTFEERLSGGLLGLLIGDALGVPYEFHPATAIPLTHQIEFEPPAEFPRSHTGVPPGTWSDDGAQALCLLASLLDKGRLDEKDLGERLLQWYDHGYMAVDGIVFDVGVATGNALRAIRAGVDSTATPPRSEYGNGSLMRVLPLALWHSGSDEALVDDAHRQSAVTHGHLRNHVCSALYCLVARRMLVGATDAWHNAVATLRAIYADDAAATEELEWGVRPDAVALPTGSGYVVDSLRSALHCLNEPNYEQCVRAAIRLGKDTDTTACVAGGLAGIRAGVQGIPDRWKQALRGREIYADLLERLVGERSSRNCT